MFHKILFLFVVSVAISLFFVMPNDSFATNTLKNVINFSGTYPAGVESHEITLSTPITNVSKAFSFITFRHATDNDASASFRSWELVDNVFTLFKTITINSTEVDEDITLYPHLLNITDTDLRDDALPSGNDIIFTDNTGTVQFPHEIEDYDSSTGALVAWIGVPNVSNATDTTYRMWYSNAGASNSENATGVWDSDFDMVMHLHDDFLDSTINSNDGASTNTVNAVGQIADGESWDGAGDRIEVTDDPTLDNLSAWTISTWVSRATSDEDDSGIVMKSGNDDPEWTNSYGIAQVAQTNEICAWAVASETEQICFTPAEVFNQTYLVVTSNGTDLTLYSNGTEITTGNFTGTPVVNDGDLLIGKGQAGGMGANNDFVWDGDMDEVRVSGVARSSDYISTTYCDQQGNSICPFDSIGSETSGEAFDLGIKVRINGHSGTPANNDAVDFVGYVVEYTNDSDMFVQHESFTLGASATEGEKFQLLPTAVNSSTTMILPSGIDFDGVNEFIGTEEFATWRIVNSTHWGWEVFDTPATGDNNIYAQIVDWNVPTVRVQTGNTTMVDSGAETVTQTPPIAVQNNQTMFFATYHSDGATDEQSNRLMLYMQLQDDGDMVFNRDSTSFGKFIQWQLVEFLDSDMFMIHNGTCIAFGTLPDCEEAGAKMASGTTTFDFPIPTTNTTTSIPFSPNAGGFGFSNGRLEGGDRGRIDSSMVTMELTSPTNVRMTRGASSEDGAWGMEVITWGNIAGGNIDLDVSDVVSVIDQEILNITKVQSDTASAGDTVNTNGIFVIELSDQGVTTDVTAINVTKLNLDLVSALDNVDLDTLKGLTDTASVTDLVGTSVTTLLLLTDLATTTDDVKLAITKIFEDDVVTSDEINFVVSKLLADTATVSDLTETAVTFGVDELDQVTADDLVILDVTKQLSDITAVIDDLDLDTTKVFIDTTSIVDTTSTSLTGGVNQTDTSIVFDNVTLDLTKLIQEIAITSDNVVLERVVELMIDDTVITSDPSILLSLTSAPPTNGTGGGTGSSSTGGGVPSLQRLVGLSIESELFFTGSDDDTIPAFSLFQPQTVAVGNEVPSDFIISTFGRDDTGVQVTEIEADLEFTSWFLFPTFPQPLSFETEVDTSRTINDPARFQNTALQDYILTPPTIACSDVDPFESLMIPCIDPIIYEIPVTFTLTKGGSEFDVRHIVTVDNSRPVTCDAICEFANFLVVNWYWLAGIVVVFMMLYVFGGKVVGKKGVRTIRRIDRKAFSSFEASPKRKFKRGRR